jgi:asparagine synthase (glutamine-hydrolysing)
MCGFFGRIVPPGAGAVPLEVGLPWIARRGPDSQRVWRSRTGAVELLHARLAIVDKTAVAHQPLSAPERDVTIAFNGEVYNHQELRGDLGDRRFVTKSDTEVLMALYLKYGLEGLARAKGMIVCAIADEARREVVLFRDAVGKKPLFLARWAGQVLFGTNLLPLLAVSGARARIADDAGDTLWRHQSIGPLRSAFDGAEPMRPGEAIRFDFSGREIGRERLAPPLPSTPAPTTHADAVEQFGQLLRLAVRRRLQDNPSPCLMLSGGLDSTAIAVAMTREKAAACEPIRAVTLGAIAPLLNDEPYARFAARKLGLPLTVVKPAPLLGRGSAIAERVQRALARQDEPMSMLSYFSRAELLTEVGKVGRIVLTGDGGDEVLLGYDQTARWVRAEGEPEADSLELSGPPTPPWMSAWGKGMNGPSLLGHNFPVLDRASAEQGIEARCPFMDWDLMAFLRSLPPELLLAGDRPKGLLRAWLADWPHGFLNRPKAGFTLNLRWAWGASGFVGLRELVRPSAVERFGPMAAPGLRGPPRGWATREVFRNFTQAWTMIVWSAFEMRIEQAERAALSRSAA